ncbi:hypothetical protein [Brenneria roseae]|nr:hypothetical protein [Brenneria roseae]
MKEMMVIGYDSPLFKEGINNFMFVKRIQGWEIQLDADHQQVIFTR